MRRLLVPVLLSALASAACVAAQPAPEAGPAASPFYEMVVTAPGSRSQGVRGTLYDAAGQPLPDVPTLEPVQTAIGPFDQIGCQYLWSVCGYLRRAEGFVPGGPDNDPTATGPTLFRVSRTGPAAAPVYRGELFDGAAAVGRGSGRIVTPMGIFVWRDGPFMGQGWSGWIPLDWLPADQRP